MERIAGLLAVLPRERGQLLNALHLVQHELGWVPREAMRLVAKHLRLTEAEVYGPATFYSEFRLSPPPRTLVTWCSGPSCRIVGGLQIKEALEAELGCRLGQNGPTAAGGGPRIDAGGGPGDLYGLWQGQCNGTCERAPQLWVNGRVIGPLTVAEAVRLARRIKAGEEVALIPEGAVEIQPALRQHQEALPAQPEVAE